jgi:hypothetical protein
MRNGLTDKERLLAGQVAALHDTTARPRIESGGMVGETLNFIAAHIPPVLVKIALIVFLGYHAWDYFNRAQQMVAQVESKRADATETQAKADSVNTTVDGQTTARAKLKADLDKLRADANTARANAQALGTQTKDGTLRLQQIRADVETMQYEAQKADAEQAVQNEVVSGGVTRAVAQRRAEIAALNAENGKMIQQLRARMKLTEGGPDAMIRRGEEQSRCILPGMPGCR